VSQLFSGQQAVDSCLVAGDRDRSDSESVQAQALRYANLGMGTLPVHADSPPGPGPTQGLRLVKLFRRVTLPGFEPVHISSDPRSASPGNNLTVVGYGSNSSWRAVLESVVEGGGTIYSYPGAALEGTVSVQPAAYCFDALYEVANWTASFCALPLPGHFDPEARGAGPCLGAFVSEPRELGPASFPFRGPTRLSHKPFRGMMLPARTGRRHGRPGS
jgi:hypothetical protein